jgi:hypothetical protein
MMNRETRREKKIPKATPNQAAAIKAMEDHAMAWLQKRMQEPDAKLKNAAELFEEYWQSVKKGETNEG